MKASTKSGRVWYRPGDDAEYQAFFAQCQKCQFLAQENGALHCQHGIRDRLAAQLDISREDTWNVHNWFTIEEIDHTTVPAATCRHRDAPEDRAKRDDPKQLCLFDCPLPRR